MARWWVLGWRSRAVAGRPWTPRGRCPNPRISIDNNQSYSTGTTEVIQLDNPQSGQTFRIMVHNYWNLPAQPTVFVYCGGQLAAELPPPIEPADFTFASGAGFSGMWRPADVTFLAPGGPTAGCEVVRLRLPGGTGDYVTADDPSY